MANDANIQRKIEKQIADLTNQKDDEQVIHAQQIIAEIGLVDSRAAFGLVQSRIQKSRKNIKIMRVFARIAAILFVPLLVASVWLSYLQISKINLQSFAVQEITSPPGIRSQVILPDGSKVWLNAESTIKFRVPFPKDARMVDILGEAFFDVTKNPEQPFVVQSGKMKVEVLGTRFNCKAFAEDKNMEVVLEEGKIALSIQGSRGIVEEIMQPGDRAVIENESGETIIRKEEINKYIAWHTGKLVFDNTPMGEVAQLLERWYGVDVIVKDLEIMNYRFTTTFTNESLFQVIELLELSSPIRVKYVAASIGKNNLAETKSKIIITKK